MSYILEALKKAQAERQLGDLPTIHAPAIGAAPASGAGLRNKPLVLALAALGLVTAGLLALVWRPAPQAAAGGAPASPRANVAVAQTAMAAPAPAPGPVAPAPTAVVTSVAPMAVAPAQPSPAPASAPAAQASLPVPAQAVAASPGPGLSVAAPQRTAPARVAAPASALAGEALPRHHAGAPDVAAKPAPSEPAAGAVAAASAPAAQDEAVQNVRDLPEPIQRAIPPITLGGYMYSRNPADRLLLIDKVLRHEGEEVAPGLVLDKLLPKAAVFTFKGYRYRVPY
ncbi:general secretion pathway protein GspB [Duganella sp. FT3S]|uniref:General secretion pathway protein GspB n=1 Tax=Rugamonas fusca TaxID=2758568 RepID=A0A7W2EG65_9BURK|nr:general secretion pathway protein GspB [Rugamonas fusca]MBA5605340.1 general secretion pathway protein GspB [Rugamonas fusca]